MTITADSAKAVAHDLKVADDLKDMMNLPGWKEYCRLLELKIREKERSALQPAVLNPDVDGITQAMVGESAKGAILGLRLALELPSMIVKGAAAYRTVKSAGEKK